MLRFGTIALVALTHALAGADVLHDNGSIVTGTHLGNPISEYNSATTTQGVNYRISQAASGVDDFYVPEGQVWLVTHVELVSFVGGQSAYTFTGANIRFREGDPNSLNRLITSQDGLGVQNGGLVAYRVPSTNLGLLTNACYRVVVELPFSVPLTSGQYWLESSLSSSSAGSAIFAPYVTLPGLAIPSGNFQRLLSNSNAFTPVNPLVLPNTGSCEKPFRLLGTAIPAPDVARSNFATSNEGWDYVTLASVFGSPPVVTFSAPATHSPGDGEPAGCISRAVSSSEVAFWRAPSSFLGDKSAAFGGEFRYDLKSTSTGSMESQVNSLILVGNGQTIRAIVGQSTPNWRTQKVELRPDWFKPRLSEANFKSVLANLTALYIRGRSRFGNQTISLDNPHFAKGALPTNPLSNPSFESTGTSSQQTFTTGQVIGSGWTVFSGSALVTDDLFSNGSNPFADPVDGDQFLAFPQNSTAHEVRQPVQLEEGITYQVSWLQSGILSEFASNAQASVSVYKPGGSPVAGPATFYLRPTDAWERMRLTFKATTSGLHSVALNSISVMHGVLDNVSVTPVGQIEGTIELEGIIPDEAGSKVDFIVYQPSTSTSETFAVTLGPGGTFSFNPGVFGEAEIWVKENTFLAKRVSNAILGLDVVRLDTVLLNGDCDGNNAITTDDYLIFSLAFDTATGDPGFEPRADLDRNGAVTTDDYLIFSNNFDLEGDPQP